MRIAHVALDVPVPGLFDYAIADDDNISRGTLVEVPFGPSRRTGVVVDPDAPITVAPERLRPVFAAKGPRTVLPENWLALVEFAARYYHAPIGQVAALGLPPRLRAAACTPLRPAPRRWALSAAGRDAIAGLASKSAECRLLEALLRGETTESALTRVSRTAPRLIPAFAERGWIRPAHGPECAPDRPPDLNADQAAAVAAVEASNAAFGVHLLHGVTGSGKTEVYLRLIASCLERGLQALALVPEIGLAPGLEMRIRQRFPDRPLVTLHSGLSDGERARGFLRALSGEAKVVVGTRLAVFAPLSGLGLVVVDEEHDPSYKQQDGVRYSARDLAIFRARLSGIPAVLGSATPSLESFHAARSGRYQLLTLRQRAVALAMPAVRCVDTRRVQISEGLSEDLLAAISARLGRGEQSLVFINRRGYAPALSCPACGWTSRCPHCSANLVVHAADHRLRCHHCGHETPIVPRCEVCGNQDIRALGRGTQRLERALAERFPAANVVRFDRDSARSLRNWTAMLEAVRDGSAQILVGTQILAKGHDFPGITLVGVVNADASLFAADFRAAERLFGQILQVGGRSGRASLPGEVLIQTEHPDHPIYRAICAHDYERFAAGQLDERRVAGLPPFRFQAMLRAEARTLELAIEFLRRAAASGQEIAQGVTVYDAVPMRLARKATWERAQLLAESDRRPALQAFLERWMPALRALGGNRSVRWHLDVDPIEF